MRVQGFVAVLGVAAVTSAFTLALLGPGAVSAVDDAAVTIKPMIATPELKAEGGSFTLSTDKAEYKPGESPVLTLRASNPTDKPVETNVQVQIWSSSPTSRMSRSMPIPRPAWTGEESVRLEPGETKSFELPTETPLAPNQQVTISLSAGKQSILAGTIELPNATQQAQTPVQALQLLNQVNQVNQPNQAQVQ